MNKIQLISTDFDGTLFAEFENPPVPAKLQKMILDLQAQGAKWVINTGRDMSSLMETLDRSHLEVRPDYLVLVEREIFHHEESSYVALEPWNHNCSRAHKDLFRRIQPDLPRLTEWINKRFHAMIYEDPFSPFCLIAGNNADADIIHEYLNEYCASVPNLTVVRNDVYARFSHAAYNKGTALAEVARRLNVTRSQIFAVGDHFNDLPMLTTEYAAFLAAPHNAVPVVKAAMVNQGGYISRASHGSGVAEALEHYLSR